MQKGRSEPAFELVFLLVNLKVLVWVMRWTPHSSRRHIAPN